MTQTRFELTTAVLAAALIGCSDDIEEPRDQPESPPEHYVLVHGAWMGAWAWNDVASVLEAAGANVVAVELPGHGADPTPPTMVTLDAYVTEVLSTIDAQPDPVVLVGHSMAGVVITEVAERAPAKIAKLVYVAAYVPEPGDTLQSLAMSDADSHVGPMLTIDANAGTASLPQAALQDIFCADCSPAQLGALVDNYRDEPLYPFTGEVHPSEANWGSTAKHYIYTAEDHAVSHPFQQAMTQDHAFVSTATLPTSHSPMLSQPALLAETLLGL